MKKNVQPSVLLLTLSLCLSFAAGLFGQGFEKRFPPTPPSTGYELSYGSELVKSPDGGFLLIGANGNSADLTARVGRVLKLDQDGAILWEQILPAAPGRKVFAAGGLALADGSFLVAGKDHGGGWPNDSVFLTKIDAAGQTVWQRNYLDVSGGASAGGGLNEMEVLPLSDGSFYLVWNNIDGGVAVSRIAANGARLWVNFSQGYFATYRRFKARLLPGDIVQIMARSEGAQQVLASEAWMPDGSTASNSNITITTDQNNIDVTAIGWLSDGNLIAGCWGGSGVGLKYTVEKRSPSGSLLWSTVVFDEALAGWAWDGQVAEADNGDVLVSFDCVLDGWVDNYMVPVVRLGADGQVKWSRTYNPVQENTNYFAYNMVPTADGGMAALNSRRVVGADPNTLAMYFVKTDSTGRSLAATIVGRVMKDLDENCVDSPVEPPLKNLPVTASNALGDNFYATSDALGNYSMDVDTGSYLVSVQPPSVVWQPCQSPVAATVAATGDTAVVDFPIQASAICPQLEVSMSGTRLRPCFSSVWTIEYCNIGTDSAIGPYVIVHLDSLLTPLSASVPMTLLPGNEVRLDLPNLADGECGTATLTTETSCNAVLGQTLCAEAHIFPDTICGDTIANKHPVLKVTGKCLGNSTVNFTIKNVGNGDMTAPSGYIVIEEDMIQLNDSGTIPLLNVGQSATVSVPATGATFRIEVDPAVGSPAWSMPSAMVEGCGTGPTFGFGSMFQMDDDATFVDIECKEVVNSLDPNDKLAFPKGARAEHFLPKNTDIEYTIDFQNTGTDTAYLVTVRDTLDAALDPASIRMGGASHPYKWELLGHGVLKVSFENIGLVDSGTNEAASHGRFQFRIAQKKDLPDGTLIQNSAAIFFDGNAPVITNTVFHNIGHPWTTATFDQPEADGSVAVAPNPFAECAEVRLKNAAAGAKQFTLMDASGRVLQVKTFDGDRFPVHAGGLPVGLYFFRIENREGFFVSGKLVKQ